MPRIARAIAAGYPHHITQRGNYRQTIFESDTDYQQYLKWLREYCSKYALKLWAYCLMSNHVHFIGVPMYEDSLARTFNTLHMRYAQYVNKKRGANGHVWQGRFFSCLLDERHLHAAVRYVENNPVRAGITERPQDYNWSSAGAHVHKKSDLILSNDCYLTKDIDDWSAYLAQKDDKKVVDNIRMNSRTGRPCGDDSFVRKAEELLVRRLAAFPKGRPRKRE